MEPWKVRAPLPGIVFALGEKPAFAPGDRVRVGTRQPIGHYRVAFAMTEIWPGYAGQPHDGLLIEIYESWLERIDR